jgi:hypothetical protein
MLDALNITDEEVRVLAAEGAGKDEPDLETFAWRRENIEGLVTEECLKHSSCGEPLDDHVARVGLRLGFAPEAITRWRDLADPPATALAVRFDDEFPWQSSA